ncbi:hypothetical protein HPB47_010987 [Ixodes persulcatus]|uniref:Uncharacterized protein n=1 Tax=Ixodes persulcatus TaxID=34615 RepID=A0AC60NXJ3_IXOPE|nr:hypothetical protein HPB47_010987 [Ixodes persulcatus]
MTPLVFITLVVVSLWCADAATVDKGDGGYENVVVAIGKDVVYHKDIIVNLKALFRKASAFLLEATKGKFYFKSVMISVPMSWPKKSGRKEVWEDPFDKADVQVVSGLTEPGTLNPGRSFPEDFNPVRLPAEFLRDLNTTSTKKFGKPEYHLIHHWANHRYGVFSEHATTPDKEVYCSHGKRQATRCSEEIGVNMTEIPGAHCPKDDACMGEEDECNVTFFQANPQAKASIIYGKTQPYAVPPDPRCQRCKDPEALPNLEHALDSPRTEAIEKLPADHRPQRLTDWHIQFCDNDTHTPDALNLQNDRYLGRSTWDVITKHDDYVGGTDSPYAPVLAHERCPTALTKLGIAFVIFMRTTLVPVNKWDHDVTKQQVALRYQFLGRPGGVNCGDELAASVVLKMRRTALSNNMIWLAGTSKGAENRKD